MQVEEEDLVLDKLASGDRPSVYAAGIVAAKALQTAGVAVLMTDVLGRVHLVPAQFIEVKQRPKLQDEDLSSFSEDEALQLLVAQGESEDAVLQYLQRRAAARSDL